MAVAMLTEDTGFPISIILKLEIIDSLELIVSSK